MNIVYVNHYAGSPEMGMAYRTWYMAREWQRLGHTVTVIAGDFSHLRSVNPDIERDFQTVDMQGVQYIFIKTGSYVGNGAKRAVSMFRFTIKLWLRAGRLARELKPDVVISSSTYPLDTYPCRRIARVGHAALIHEAHDLWPLTLVELGGMSKRHPFVIALQIAENAALSRSDRVVGLLPQSYIHMLKHGLRDRSHFTAIPNGIVPSEWEKPAPAPQLHAAAFKSAKEKGNFTVCYLGGHALSNALDMLLDAAELLKGEKIMFFLVGKGAKKAELEKGAAARGLENVVFLPPVPKDSVPSVLALADALYVGAAPCSLYRYGVSMNKLYDYMMSAKPIVNAVNASNNEVEQAECGISVLNVNAGSIARAVKDMASLSPEQRGKMGENGHSWVLKNCDYAVLARRFVGVMETARANGRFVKRVKP